MVVDLYRRRIRRAGLWGATGLVILLALPARARCAGSGPAGHLFSCEPVVSCLRLRMALNGTCVMRDDDGLVQAIVEWGANLCGGGGGRSRRGGKGPGDTAVSILTPKGGTRILRDTVTLQWEGGTPPFIVLLYSADQPAGVRKITGINPSPVN